ncbi:MAG: hypothetical protein Q7U89_00025 [Coriobacteriia bacterium]|nr:hypothetical protein [Coriobacteriia bacterium]
MYSQTEVVNLLLGISIIPILLGTHAIVPSRHTSGYAAAYVFMLASYVSTVAEGYLLPDVFNFIEHGALAVAGCLFAVTLFLRRREQQRNLRES